MAEDDNKRNKGIKMMINSFNKFESFIINLSFYYTGADRPRFNDFMFWPILERIAVRHRNLVNENATGRIYQCFPKCAPVHSCVHKNNFTVH